MADVPPVAGERTWTIYRCWKCDVEDGEGLRPFDCLRHLEEFEEPVSAVHVVVVELSRLRAAEEERDKGPTRDQAFAMWSRQEARIEEYDKANVGQKHRIRELEADVQRVVAERDRLAETPNDCEWKGTLHLALSPEVEALAREALLVRPL